MFTGNTCTHTAASNIGTFIGFEFFDRIIELMGSHILGLMKNKTKCSFDFMAINLKVFWIEVGCFNCRT